MSKKETKRKYPKYSLRDKITLDGIIDAIPRQRTKFGQSDSEFLHYDIKLMHPIELIRDQGQPIIRINCNTLDDHDRRKEDE